MSNPRAAVQYDGLKNYTFTVPIDDSTITYDATEENGSAQVGLAVTIDSNEKAALAGDAEGIAGKLVKVTADDFAVIERGFVTLPGGTSASLTNMKSIVGDLLVAAKGYIRETNTAQAAELGVADGKIIDPSTTTAVVVYLP